MGKFEIKSDAGGKFRFNLKAANGQVILMATNGQVIGTSEMYSSNSAMETGISSVKTNAPKATVVDNS